MFVHACAHAIELESGGQTECMPPFAPSIFPRDQVKATEPQENGENEKPQSSHPASIHVFEIFGTMVVITTWNVMQRFRAQGTFIEASSILLS